MLYRILRILLTSEKVKNRMILWKMMKSDDFVIFVKKWKNVKNVKNVKNDENDDFDGF